MPLKNYLNTLKPNGQTILPMLDRWLMARPNDKRQNDRAKGVIHPSQIHNCKRAIVYSMIEAQGKTESHPPKLIRIFDNGHSVHDRLQDYFIRSGMIEVDKSRPPDERCKRKYPGLPGMPKVEVFLRSEKNNIQGSADGVFLINNNRAVLEIKSINSHGFAGLKKAKPEHVLQAHCYMIGLGIPTSIFIYENKDNQEMKEFKIPLDPKIVAEIEARCKDINTALVNRILPEREMCPNGPSDPAANRCPYANICFGNKRFADVENKEIWPLIVKNIPAWLKNKSTSSPVVTKTKQVTSSNPLTNTLRFKINRG